MGRASLRARHFGVAQRTYQFGLHHPRAPGFISEAPAYGKSDDEDDHDDDDDEDESGDGDRACVHGNSEPVGGSCGPYSFAGDPLPCRPAPAPGPSRAGTGFLPPIDCRRSSRRSPAGARRAPALGRGTVVGHGRQRVVVEDRGQRVSRREAPAVGTSRGGADLWRLRRPFAAQSERARRSGASETGRETR